MASGEAEEVLEIFVFKRQGVARNACAVLAKLNVVGSGSHTVT